MPNFKVSPIHLGVIALIGFSSLNAVAQQKVEEVFVTGSAIRRIVSDEALPIQVVTKEEIKSFGVSNTEELMKFMPIAQSMGGTHSSLDGAGGVSNYGQATISLRGIGDQYTLVLVNGRPANGNLNLIPLAAIERIEILQDGASSTYGSDAIAGVVNFIMTNNFQGVEVSANVGTPTRPGGGQRKTFGVTVGKGNYATDGFNITGSFSAETEKELYAGDRDFAKTGNVFPYLVGAATGQGNIEGGWIPGVGKASTFKGSTWYGNPLAASGNCADISMFLYPSLSGGKAPYCLYDSAKDVRLVPEREALSVSFSGKYKLNNSVQLFGDAIISQTDLTSRYQPSPVRYSFLTTDSLFAAQKIDPALLISPSNPNYKIAADYLTKQGFGSLVGQSLAITSRVFDFGPRTNTNNLNDSRFVAGARGDLNGHAWESAVYSMTSKVDSGVADGYFSQVKFAQIVNSRNDWNPWAPASAQTDAFKQAVQAAKYTGSTIGINTKTVGGDAKITGPAFNAPGGEAMYAAGVQYQKYELERNPDSALASGDIAGLGGAQLALTKDRSNTAAFGELSIPVSKTLELNTSARHDNYSDFGGADTYKANARWKASNIAVVRASMGTGFRAPSLTSLWTPQTTGTSAQFTDPKFPNMPNQQVQEVSGGNPNLQPEKSKQKSIGLVLTPVKNLTIGIDAWNIEIDGKITSASAQETVSRFRSGDAAYAGLVTLNPSTGMVDQVKSVFANIGSASYSGIDLNAAYKMNLESGTLGLSMYGTYMNKADETSPSGTISRKVGTMVESNGDPVIGADSGGVIVKWKHLLTVSYETGPWRYTLGQNFYTGYRTGDRMLDGEPNYVPNQTTYNAQVSYSGVKNLKLTLGVKNLLDKNPPIYVPASNQFASGYDISMYDPRARFVYLSANYKFN
ncbi:TonB-dependent receptor [Limnohabitans sp. 103DPR2]|uniref:TonB-dependent receptor n=1 Tax=Limnohabitans sp. 103DPR2 TaxID=1678129 RepID=UPI0006DBFC57|nr:TonB-dependent receptor [Limnohabitans sp. 103DPR2]ALK92148.1 Colicin I receptor precursor [Limnohabitans sp. 103DPR2]